MLVSLEANRGAAVSIHEKKGLHLLPVIVSVILGQVEITLNRAAFDMDGNISIVGQGRVRGITAGRVVHLIKDKAIATGCHQQRVHA